MKLRITESERAHILGMHQSAKLKNLLKEDEFGGLFSLSDRKLEFATMIHGHKDPGSVDINRMGGGDQLPNGVNGNNYYVDENTVYINIGPYRWSEDNEILFLIMDKTTTSKKGTPSCVKLSDPNPGMGKGPAYVEASEHQSSNDCGYTFALTVPIVPDGVGKPQDSELGPYELVDKSRPEVVVGKISFVITFDEGNKVESKVKEKTGPKRLANDINNEVISAYNDTGRKSPVIDLTFGEIKAYAGRGLIREVYIDDYKYYSIYICGQQFVSESGLLKLDLYDNSSELEYVLQNKYEQVKPTGNIYNDAASVVTSIDKINKIDENPSKTIYLEMKTSAEIGRYFLSHSSSDASCKA